VETQAVPAVAAEKTLGLLDQAALVILHQFLHPKAIMVVLVFLVQAITAVAVAEHQKPEIQTVTVMVEMELHLS
jgi:hypothetical protein